MPIGAAVVGAISAGAQYYQSQQQADAAKKAAEAQTQAAAGVDQNLQQTQSQNLDMAHQDAAWMQMKSAGNTMQGLSTTAPTSLLALQGQNKGAQGAVNAGKL